MRRGLPFVALVVALLVPGETRAQALPPPPPPPPPQAGPNAAPMTTGSAAISGVVIDAATSRPIAGAVVYLGPPTRGPVGRPVREITDAKGRFVFTELPAFDGYFLQASKFGYFDGFYGRGSSGALGARVTVAEGQWVRDLTIPMSRGASISGLVVDEQSQPVVGAFVRVMTIARIAGQERIVAGAVATTDDRGMYRIGTLSAGRYYVYVPSVQHSVATETSDVALAGMTSEAAAVARAAGRALPTLASPMVDAGSNYQLLLNRYPVPARTTDGRPTAYAPVFFPASPTIAGAVVITLSGPEDRGGVDLRLVAAPTAHITGVVEGPPDAYAGLTLRLVPTGNEELGEGSEVATALVGDGGRFAFLNVPAGTYVVLGYPVTGEYSTSVVSQTSRTLPATPAASSAGEGSYGSVSGPAGIMYRYRTNSATSRYWVRQPVNVEGRDLALTLTMQPAMTISGRLVWEGQRSPASLSMGVQIGILSAQPARGTPSLGVQRSQTDAQNPERFSISGLLPGEYVMTSLLDRIKSFICGGRDYASAAIDTTSGADYTDCVVTLTDKTTTFSGTVRQTSRDAIDTAVIVFPAEREQWGVYGFSPPRIKAVQTGGNGSFRFTNLPEGDYLVVAVPGAQILGWQDPKFLETAAAQATRVRVVWGGTTTQELELKTIATAGRDRQ